MATTVQEHPETMLDVHPPLEALHTWKGFCIHIATIVIGLCIAVGLEQTVEYFHHRHQVAETREALRAEREGNIHAFAESVSEFHRQSAALINNIIVLRYLQQHPDTQEAQLPGILVWHAIPGKYSDSAWRTAQQSNVTALMPQDEVRRYAALYAHIEDVARAAGFSILRLETGVRQPAAVRLYESAGFRPCAAFEPYTSMAPSAIKNSLFYEKQL